jgi:DNA-binding PadR family transcriptional regulator
MLELAVLGTLKDQPAHGYELKKRLGETLGFAWGVSYGSLYPALRRLEKAGAITAATDTAPVKAVPATGSIGGETAAARLRRMTKPTRRTRKSYRITDRGEALFIELMTANDNDDDRTFALKLAYCRHLDAPARLALLETRRLTLADRLGRSAKAGQLDRYMRSLVEHRTKSVEADLAWVDELIAAEHSAAGEKEGVTA